MKPMFAITLGVLSTVVAITSVSSVANAEPRGTRPAAATEAKATIHDFFAEFKPGSAPAAAVKALQERARKECAKKANETKYGDLPCAEEGAILEGDFFVAPAGAKTFVALADITTGMDGVTAVLRHVQGTKKTYYVYTGAVDPKKQNLDAGSLMGTVTFAPDFNAQYAELHSKIGAPKTQADGSYWFELASGGVVVLRRVGSTEASKHVHMNPPTVAKSSSDAIDESVANSLRRTPAPVAPTKPDPKKAKK